MIVGFEHNPLGKRLGTQRFFNRCVRTAVQCLFRVRKRNRWTARDLLDDRVVTRSSNSVSPYTWFTSPSSSASSAERIVPRNTSSLATFLPTRSGSNADEPMSTLSPTCLNTNPMDATLEASWMSQAMTRFAPPAIDRLVVGRTNDVEVERSSDDRFRRDHDRLCVDQSTCTGATGRRRHRDSARGDLDAGAYRGRGHPQWYDSSARR